MITAGQVETQLVLVSVQTVASVQESRWLRDNRTDDDDVQNSLGSVFMCLQFIYIIYRQTSGDVSCDSDDAPLHL